MSDLVSQVGRVVQLAAALGVLLLIIVYSGPWNAARIVGVAIAVPSVILLFVARFQLGRSFAVSPRAKELVTHGLYSRIRNPMYTFSFLLILGLFVALQKAALYPLLAVILVVQIVRARQEAKVLEQKFGESYRQYRKSTWF